MIKKITFVFIILFFIAVGSGELEEKYEITEFHNYSPAYTLIPIPNELIVNPGGEAKIDLYISGLGKIKENKILLRIPQDLLNSENPGNLNGSIICGGMDPNNVSPMIDVDSNNLLNMRIVLNECNFWAVVDDIGDDSKNMTLTAPMLLSERDNSDFAPIHIKMNIAENAPHGDQYIYLVFTYTDGTKWYQDKEKIKIHVNNPVEENRKLLFVILAVLAFAFPWISESTKKTYNTLLSSRLGILTKLITILAMVYVAYLIIISL